MVGEPDPVVVRGMTHMLAHRGPDGEGVICSAQEGFGLGHRRLSILDLSEAGSQPMADPSGRYWITYNGEVYNFLELRKELEGHGRSFRSKTDTEVVLASYELWGRDCLDRLNGMFAFAIWDRHDRRLFAARDRMGIKPLYWALASGTLLLASEAKAILASGRVPIEADPEITHNPWHYPVSPRTGFKNIFKLPPAHFLTWQRGNVEVRRWWDIAPAAKDPGERQVADELEALMQDAVASQMLSDRPIGAFLSGGLDSSTIVAMMRQHHAGPIRTFSISFRESDRKLEAVPNDQWFAKKVASHFGCVHNEIELAPDVVTLLPKMVWHLDEPLFDPAAINTYLIAGAARTQGIPVLLNGMGVDEVFGGYRKHHACLLADRYQRILPQGVQQMIRRIAERLPVAGDRRGFEITRWAKRFLGFASLGRTERFLLSDLSISSQYYGDLYTDTGRYPYAQLAEVEARASALADQSLSYLTRMCLSDTTLYLPDHNLAYMDKATMAMGVESRPPLLDHRIVELAFQLSDSYRIQGRRQKVIFRQAAARRVPRFVCRRPKASFGAPLRAWIRRDLREMVDDMLSERALRQRGLYQVESVRRRVVANQEGREDHAHFIWNLMCRELWLDAYIDRGGSALRDAKMYFHQPDRGNWDQDPFRDPSKHAPHLSLRGTGTEPESGPLV
jgi:asparagine synthase (glutamine-hydrolysing)